MTTAVASTTSTGRRTIIRLSVRTAFIDGCSCWCRLHQTEDQRLHLKFTAHAAAEANLNLPLHPHPVDIRGLATGVARELLPAILKHPLDFAFRPQRHLAGIGSGDDTAKIHARWSHHGAVGADRSKDRDNAIFCELLTFLQHAGINNSVARLIEQLDTSLHWIRLGD